MQRHSAARTLWRVALNLVVGYNWLPRCHTTAKAVLEDIRSVIAVQREPDRAAATLLDTTGDVPQRELGLAMLCAEPLVFLGNMFPFGRGCGDMHRLLRFIDVKRALGWRIAAAGDPVRADIRT
jgi:hypothetical protein